MTVSTLRPFLFSLVALALFGLLPSCNAVREMAIQSERDGIIRELDTMSNNPEFPVEMWAREWAGEYYVGDGTGMNVLVLLGPTSDIVYTDHGCLGLYDSGSGHAEGTFDEDGDGTPDGLLIKWTKHPSDHYGFGSRKWYFVRWPGPDGTEGRKYFVPEDQMMHLIDNYNAGGFARDGLYFAPQKTTRAGEGRFTWHGRLPAR